MMQWFRRVMCQGTPVIMEGGMVITREKSASESPQHIGDTVTIHI